MSYKKGDIVVIHFPFTDLTDTKKRPALVISNEMVNQTGDYLLVQITSKAKNDNLTLPILTMDFSNNKPLPLTSYIRLHKIFLLNGCLIISKVASVKSNFINQVINRIIELIR